MSSIPTEVWPWLTFAGLGAFHGLNPAMGWLFAVALGLHRQSRTIVMTALLPIAAGHAASIVVVAGLLALVGYLVPHDVVRIWRQWPSQEAMWEGAVRLVQVFHAFVVCFGGVSSSVSAKRCPS